MTDTYKDAKDQLDEIVEQVRKKDVSLEKSLDLLEEGVALANRCTELIDQAAWEEAEDSGDPDDFEADNPADEAALAEESDQQPDDVPAEDAGVVDTAVEEQLEQLAEDLTTEAAHEGAPVEETA